jgi:hypothetical protein
MKFARIYLPDVVIPFLFFELWYVLLAFIFVVFIETFVVKLFLNERFIRIFKVLLVANFWTTIVGYFLQGLIRISIGFIAIVSNNKIEGNDFLNSLMGNVSVDSGKLTHKINISILITLCTSVIIALVISIIAERKILIKEFDKGLSDRNITISITIANVVSYSLLFIWIYFNYLRLQK